MAKYAAFNAQVDIGTAQVETAVIVGTITGSGNATVTTTASGLAGTPLDTVVAVLDTDLPTTTATKMAVAMNLVAALTNMFTIVANGPDLILTRIAGAANDATMNIAYTNTTCTGLTPDATSNDTTAGVAMVETAGVMDISGPGLAADTVDVTTHDSTGAWEESVVSILRSGELTFEIVYDPAGATHDATTGLVYRYENRIYTYFDFIFRSTNNWTFFGYVTGFEPGAPVADGLTASVTIKITGQPTLE